MKSRNSFLSEVIGNLTNIGRLKIFGLFLILLLPLAVPALNAQTADPMPPPVTAPSLDDVEVIEVKRISTGEPKAGIGDRIEVRVANLEKLTWVAKCKIDDKPISGCEPQKIVLFLDGREIKGLYPDSGAPQLKPGILQFALTRNKDSDQTKDNDKAWTDLLGAPRWGAGRFFDRPTALSIGFENGYPLPKGIDQSKFALVRISYWWFVVCSILLLILIILLLWLSKYTGLLRDNGPLPYKDATKDPPIPQTPQTHWFGLQSYELHRPYSLARFQMAFWFVLVIISFLYIWLINGAYDTITSATLALIGIGAGTALAAVVIDSGKSQETSAKLATLQSQETILTSEIADLTAQTTAKPKPNEATLALLTQEIGAKNASLQDFKNQIKELKQGLVPKQSKSFLMDVLTDGETGISFHRFQMFVWTLILGILFIHAVWFRLSMPEFDATLLALMGISSGTYLGFKIPENQ